MTFVNSNVQLFCCLDAVALFVEKFKAKHDRLDVLINNASAFEFDTVKTTSYEIFDKHIDVNLKTPFFLSKCFVENLKNNNA